MSNLTLRDIANALNVSVSTVSKALCDSYEISEETKKRIIDYANKHHYRPNRIAKSLKQGSSKAIGVVVCSIGNAVIAEMLDGIDTTCMASGYHIIIMQSKESHEQEQLCLQFLRSHSIDGLLISPASETQSFEYLTQLQNSGLPVVLFDRLIADINSHKVGANNFEGGYQATTHLIQNGFQRIAHITIRSPFSITTERLKGYKQALTDNDLPYRSEYVKYCTYDNMDELDREVTQSIESLMNLPNPPNAIFTATDLISTRSVGLINSLGYKVPQDIALVGFTNTELADVLAPPLTTVFQPAFEIGELAANTLISIIEKKQEVQDFETIKLPTRMQIRKSSLKETND